VLSQEATAALHRQARERQSSLNSLLLWGLDRLARQTWLPRAATTIDWAAQRTQWLIPVNLRGAVKLQRDTANHVGLMDVLLPAAATPAQVHGELRSELSKDSPWAAWRLMSMARWLSPSVVSSMVHKEAERGVVHTGLFSNLGEWGMNPSSPEHQATWLFCPQTTRKTPVAAGAVGWAGRLALALQLHPMFEVSPDTVSAWVGRWLELLQAGHDAS
jgi:hypothetical protein